MQLGKNVGKSKGSYSQLNAFQKLLAGANQQALMYGLDLDGPAGKNKKNKVQFASRQQMMRYIANFKLHYKTELCRNWKELGSCEFGNECAYAHGYNELNSRRTHIHRNYKTKMCKQWHETTPGNCTYGDKCQFIHDEKFDDFNMDKWDT